MLKKNQNFNHTRFFQKQKIFFIFWLITFFVVLIIADWIHKVFIFNKNKGPLSAFTHPNNYTPFPYIMFKGKPGYYNSIGGYKGPVPSKNKDDTFRIFVIGSSSVVHGNPPFSRQLEQIFYAVGYKKVKVFNFGVISSVLGQDVARILYEVVDFYPNLVIMYGGSNDLRQPFYADPRPGYPFQFMVYENNPLSSASHRSFPWALLFYQSSILKQIFPKFFLRQFTNIDTLRSQVGYGTEKWKKQIVDVYWSYVRKAKKIADIYEFNLLVIFQAVVYGKTLHIKEGFSEKSKKNWDFMFNYLIESAERIPNKNVAFFDRSGIFDQIKEHVFFDKVHIKQDYRKYVAEELYKIIIESDDYFN